MNKEEFEMTKTECKNIKNHISAFPAFDRIKCPFCDKVYVRQPIALSKA